MAGASQLRAVCLLALPVLYSGGAHACVSACMCVGGGAMLTWAVVPVLFIGLLVVVPVLFIVLLPGC